MPVFHVRRLAVRGIAPLQHHYAYTSAYFGRFSYFDECRATTRDRRMSASAPVRCGRLGISLLYIAHRKHVHLNRIEVVNTNTPHTAVPIRLGLL